MMFFFALKGDNFNGNLFAQQALDSGASLVIVDEEINVSSDRIVRVENSLHTLQALAKRIPREPFNKTILSLTSFNFKYSNAP